MADATARNDLPGEQQNAWRKARRLAWITIIYLTSVAALLLLVMGSSQAIKALLLETALSFVPAVMFLAVAPIARRPADERFPYGYHRIVSIGFLASALAQLALGAYVLVDSLHALFHREYPTFGTVDVFGETVWQGWLIFPVLLYDAIPPIFIGLALLPLARRLNDKVLYAAAGMNKADWLTATAGIFGIAGIGLGFWWADAAAAALISLDIIYDGYRNSRDSISHLMDETPTKIGADRVDPFPAKLAAELKRLSWVSDARVRLREQGHLFFGEAFIVPADATDPVAKIQEAVDLAWSLDWRMRDIVVTLVDTLEQQRANEDAPHGVHHGARIGSS